MHNFANKEWNQEKTERVVINLCSEVNKFGSRLTLSDINSDIKGALIPHLNNDTAKTVMDSLEKKIKAGLEIRENESFLHTGPTTTILPSLTSRLLLILLGLLKTGIISVPSHQDSLRLPMNML